MKKETILLIVALVISAAFLLNIKTEKTGMTTSCIAPKQTNFNCAIECSKEMCKPMQLDNCEQKYRTCVDKCPKAKLVKCTNKKTAAACNRRNKIELDKASKECQRITDTCIKTKETCLKEYKQDKEKHDNECREKELSCRYEECCFCFGKKDYPCKNCERAKYVITPTAGLMKDTEISDSDSINAELKRGDVLCATEYSGRWIKAYSPRNEDKTGWVYFTKVDETPPSEDDITQVGGGTTTSDLETGGSIRG